MGSNLEQTHRTARGFINRPGHWTMAVEYPHLCVYCGGDYEAHQVSYPELLCPADRRALIHAAPEMLDALQCAATVLILLKDEVAALGLSADKVLPKVQAAIRKAKP